MRILCLLLTYICISVDGYDQDRRSSLTTTQRLPSLMKSLRLGKAWRGPGLPRSIGAEVSHTGIAGGFLGLVWDSNYRICWDSGYRISARAMLHAGRFGYGLHEGLTILHGTWNLRGPLFGGKGTSFRLNACCRLQALTVSVCRALRRYRRKVLASIRVRPWHVAALYQTSRQ